MRDCRREGHVYVIDDDDKRCLICEKDLERDDNITRIVRKHRWRGELTGADDTASQAEWGTAG